MGVLQRLAAKLNSCRCSMDRRTLDYYDLHSAEILAKYRYIPSGIESYIRYHARQRKRRVGSTDSRECCVNQGEFACAPTQQTDVTGPHFIEPLEVLVWGHQNGHRMKGKRYATENKIRIPHEADWGETETGICANLRQSVPIQDIFLWAQLWANAGTRQAGV